MGEHDQQRDEGERHQEDHRHEVRGTSTARGVLQEDIERWPARRGSCCFQSSGGGQVVQQGLRRAEGHGLVNVCLRLRTPLSCLLWLSAAACGMIFAYTRGHRLKK